jgi:hypothetical protein
MDLALTVNGWIDEEVIFAQQLGAKSVFAQVDLHQAALPEDAQSLAGLANRIAKAGLNLAGLSVVNPRQPGEKQRRLGWTRRLDLTLRLIQAAGGAGIRLLCLPASLFPAAQSPASIVKPLFESATYTGVRLALPASRLLSRLPGGQAEGSRGIPLDLLHSLRGDFLGLEVDPSLLLGWLESSPSTESLQQLMRKLFVVSFEGKRQAGQPSSQVPDDGLDALLAVCWHLRQDGYASLVRLGQPAHWKGDSREGHCALAFSAGYLRAVLQAFQAAH